MTIKRRTGLWTAGLVAALLGGLACGQPSKDEGPNIPDDPNTVTCLVEADWPHPSSGTPGRMDGKVRFRCTKPGATLELWIHLQQLQDEDWVTVATEHYELTPQESLRPARRAWNVRQVAMDCQRGTFRTYATMEGTAHGETRGYTADTPGVKDPCGTEW